MTRGRALAAAISAFSAASLFAQAAPPARLGLRPVAFFWQHLYDGQLLGPRGVSFDPAAGEVWVADTKNNLVGAFTPEGVPLFAFGGKGVLSEPARAVVGPHGDVYVLDNDRGHVKAFSYRGEFLGNLALPGLPAKPAIGAIATDGEGNLYVGDNENGEVLIYGPDRKLKARVGSYGSDEGQFQAIAGIAVDRERIYVTDSQVTSVQVFDRKGNFIKGWGRHEMGAQNFSLPEGIAVDGKGRVFVVDAMRHEVKVFDAEGALLDIFGGPGSTAGSLLYPADIAIDGTGRVYVVERGNGRVQIFAEEELPATARKREP